MHNSPRVWFITSALSPLAVRLMRLLLSHGDYIAAGLPPNEIEDDARSTEFRELINECKNDRKDREGWKERIRGIRCDGRVMGQCGAAVAEAVQVFGRIDILLCCTSEGIVETKLSQMPEYQINLKQLSLEQLKNCPVPLRKTLCATSSKPYTSARSTSSKLRFPSFARNTPGTLLPSQE
jgi:NAD(P)-dependent dehydrogenase (short-subunit alcohol dehydrogenase family)